MAVLTEVGAQGGCSKAQGNTLIMLAPKVRQAAASLFQDARVVIAAAFSQQASNPCMKSAPMNCLPDLS